MYVCMHVCVYVIIFLMWESRKCCGFKILFFVLEMRNYVRFWFCLSYFTSLFLNVVLLGSITKRRFHKKQFNLGERTKKSWLFSFRYLLEILKWELKREEKRNSDNFSREARKKKKKHITHTDALSPLTILIKITYISFLLTLNIM